MEKTKAGMTRGRAVLLVLGCAALLLGLLFLRAFTDRQRDLRCLEGRQSFLRQLGWEIDPASEEHKTVRLPETLEGVLADYNDMQRRQGYDLGRHLGEKCEQYSYELVNYPGGEQTVLVTLYLQGRRLIAGDIHSTALDGFMHGLRAAKD